MQKECIDVQCAPKPAAPYSVAVGAGELLFLSGQVPLKPDGSGLVRGTIQEEARQVLDNVKAVLEECGSSLGKVVKVTALLSDMEDFAEFNAVYGEYFTEDLPARTCFQAGRLPLDVKVEVEVVAIR